jgi:hypothetical protein
LCYFFSEIAPVPEAAPAAEPTTEESAAEAKDEVKEDVKPKKEKPSAAKVGRRLSARVGDFFKTKPKEAATSPKVEEAPPKLEEPTPVEPLEHPATEAPAAEPTVVEQTKEEPKPDSALAGPSLAVTAAA